MRIPLLHQETILLTRLHNLGLGDLKFSSISDLLTRVGAIQSQDVNAVKWAIGLRLKDSTITSVEQMLQDEQIIRTHVLRPTWHYVHKKDIRWMLELTAPRVETVIRTQYKKSGLENNTFIKSRKLLYKLLTEYNELQPSEIRALFEKNHINAEGLRLQLLIMDAELHQIICNGNYNDNHVSYTLFENKIPLENSFNQNEAIEELLNRYIFGHGPVTIKDFTRWSGLTISDAKNGLKRLQERNENQLIHDGDFWYFEIKSEEILEKQNHLLPRYDEYFNGYKDKDLFLRKYGKTAEALSYNAIIEAGQIIGRWTREIKKEDVKFNFEFFTEQKSFTGDVLDRKSKEYANFLEKKLILS